MSIPTTPLPKIRVLIVDDSSLIRRLLSDILAADPDIEVVGSAANGKLALARLEEFKPDLITLDIEMPEMDGLETLRALRKTHLKLPVIMFSTLTERGSCATLDALSSGASDYVTKPGNVGNVIASMEKIRSDLVPKIKALCRRPAHAVPGIIAARQAIPSLPRRDSTPGAIDLLAIGVSTGGPNALAELMPAIGIGLPVPIVIVQHMPPLFTRLLAERIGSVSGIPCREGAADEILRPGEAWVAPGGFHMEVRRDKTQVRIALTEEKPENSCRPAVDVLFRSAALAYGPCVLAVVLTGMGQDGLRGSEVIRQAGGQILAQDEASSVVWGMPGAVAEAGLADKILPLNQIAQEIRRRIEAGSKPAFPLLTPSKLNS